MHPKIWLAPKFCWVLRVWGGLGALHTPKRGGCAQGAPSKVSRSCSQAGPCPATAQVCRAETPPSPAPLLPLFWLKSPKSITWEQNGAAHASRPRAPGSQSRSRGSFQAGSSQNWLRRAAGRGKPLRREAFSLATRHLSRPQRGAQGPMRHHSPLCNKTSGVLHFGQAARQKRSVTHPQQPSLWSWYRSPRMCLVLECLGGAPRGFGEAPSLPKSPPGKR